MGDSAPQLVYERGWGPHEKKMHISRSFRGMGFDESRERRGVQRGAVSGCAVLVRILRRGGTKKKK